MIKLKNISKIYVSRLGTGCKAVNDVSVDLPDRGMVFLLGRSGSGKSTLLNLIGGLDKVTEGEIIYNGASFSNYSNSDYDKYRSNIGFIYQDANLIENLTVRENLALTQELKVVKAEDDAIAKALDSVGLLNMIDRYSYELSGGEKQRVSLARAMIKNPNIILADEPTGNLDSVTGKLILDKLKAISTDRLVIVVSHDRGFAEQYGDRIIELEDGRIINDTDKGYLSVSTKKDSAPMNRHNLKLKYSIKMILANFRFRPLRLIVSIVLISIILILLSITQSMNSYNINESHARNLINNNYDYMSMHMLYEPLDYSVDYLDFRYYYADHANLSNRYLNKLLTDYPELIYDKQYHQNRMRYSIYYDGIYGMKLMSGAEELEDNSYYITDINAYRFINGTYSSLFSIDGTRADYYYDGEEYVRVSRMADISELQGQILYRKTYNDYIPEVKIAGVLITGYLEEYINYSNIGLNNIDRRDRDYLDFSYKYWYLYDRLFVNDNFFNINLHNVHAINHYHNLNIDISSSGDEISSNYLYIYNDNLLEHFTIIVTEDAVYQELIDPSSLGDYLNFYTFQDFVINKGEVYLTVDQYNELFVRDYDWSIDYDSLIDENYQFEAPPVPVELGQSISISIYDDTGNTLASIDNLIFKGIIVNDDSYFLSDALNGETNDYTTANGDYNLGIYMHMDDKAEFLAEFPPFVSGITFDVPKDKAYLIDFLNMSNEQHEIYPMSPIAESLYRFTIRSLINVVLIIALSILFLIIITLMLSNYITTGIRNRIKEIGILRSQGASLMDVMKIFIIESGLIALLIVVISAIITPIVLAIINKIMQSFILDGINAYTLNALTIFYILGMPFLIVLISSMLPILSIAKLKPIDAIKSIN